MKSNYLRLQGITRKNRHEAIDGIQDLVRDGGGYILDSHMFSNISIAINFEVSVGNISKFCEVFEESKMLDHESLRDLNSVKEYFQNTTEAEAKQDIEGTINLTFIHNEPDLRIESPAVPG